MANAQKYTRAACGHLAAHYERRKDEKGEYVKFGNQDIDPQKTHLNYNLAPRRGLEQIDFIRQRTTEARTLKRDDVNVIFSLCFGKCSCLLHLQMVGRRRITGSQPWD